MNRTAIVAPLILATLVTTAGASPQDDLAFNVGKATGSYTAEPIVSKLMTFKVGKACWDKLTSKDGSDRLTYYARATQRLAKALTGDDWDHIEGHGKKEETHPILDKMLEEFAPKFHYTVEIDGDDCDVSGSAMWTKYTSIVLSQLVKTPPKSGKAFVIIKANSKLKDVKFEVSKDGSTFTLSGPRGIEPSGWPNKVEPKIEQVSKR
jgi:hypothetical protein